MIVSQNHYLKKILVVHPLLLKSAQNLDRQHILDKTADVESPNFTAAQKITWAVLPTLMTLSKFGPRSSFSWHERQEWQHTFLTTCWRVTTYIFIGCSCFFYVFKQPWVSLFSWQSIIKFFSSIIFSIKGTVPRFVFFDYKFVFGE